MEVEVYNERHKKVDFSAFNASVEGSNGGIGLFVPSSEDQRIIQQDQVKRNPTTLQGIVVETDMFEDWVGRKHVVFCVTNAG